MVGRLFDSNNPSQLEEVMWKAIGSLAFGIVLLCSTVWADENRRKQIDQLHPLIGLWQFFVQVPAPADSEFVRLDLAESRWYYLDTLKAPGALNGFAPNIQNSQVRIFEIGEQKDQKPPRLLMMSNHLDGSHMICRRFYFDLPQHPSSIRGTVMHTRSKMATSMNKESFLGSDCYQKDWKQAKRGLFVGTRIW